MRPLRVLTLNIWNRSGPWEARLAAIREGLRALDPDLVALQEVLSAEPSGEGQHVDIALGSGLHAAFGPTWASGGIAFGNAVLSRWPIARVETVALPGHPKGDTDAHRSMLATEIAAPFGAIPLFVTHLSWRLHEAAVRRAEVLALEAHVRRLAPVARDGAFPAILAGDFNAEPDSDEIRFLRGLATLDGRSTYFADCHAVAGEGAGVTYSKSNPFAAASREPERRIDYVFVRGPDRHGRGQPQGARVVFDRPIGGAFASDHFGVLATIRVDEDA